MKKTGRELFVDCMYYEEVDAGKPIPTARAFCKHCGAETAKPWGFVSFNRKLGIAVECEKCGSRYIMYEHLYISRYVGKHTEYGFIPPNHGKDMEPYPRGVQDKMSADKSKRMEALDLQLSKSFGVSVDELHEMRKKWKADATVNFEKERQERIQERENQKILDKSAERKQLIADGVLVWSNSQRCLIDTRTNTPYKL